MNRAKFFLENFLSYGLITAVMRIVPFVFLPIITRLLPDTTDFGVYDLFNIICSVGIGFAFLGLYNAIFHEFFDKTDEEYKYNVTTTAFRIVFTSSIVIALLLVIFKGFWGNILYIDSKSQAILVYSAIKIVIGVVGDIFRIPTRMENNKKVYLYSALISVVSNKIIVITLILLKFGYYSLIYGVIFSEALMILYLWYYNKRYFLQGKFDWKIAKVLLKFGLPLMPVTIIYLFNQTVDRFMILRLMDSSIKFAQLGVYAFAGKIAQIGYFLYNSFSTIMMYFGYSRMKDTDNKEFIGKLFSIAFVLITSFFMIIFLFKDLIFNILFTGEYLAAVKVFPYLMMIPLYLVFMLILEQQIMISKKTYITMFNSIFGLSTTILFNIILIPKYKILGAAISSLSGYTVTFILNITIIYIRRLIVLDYRIIYMMILFILLFVYINIKDLCLETFIVIAVYLMLTLALYHKEGKQIYYQLRSKD
jgi:O-antigen/teichoic acid export membrane protein